ncbi:MAG: hypothetical protein PHI55_06810 [Burkholderiaceae bacterium]|nr:hypothetical protein [Burkholderiaceae bacterium]
MPRLHATALPRLLRWSAVLAAMAALAAVFAWYTAPDFMVRLADQMWACF